MYAQIAANKRKTWLLITLFSILVVLVTTAIGIWAGASPEQSVILGFLISTGYSLIAYYTADKTVLFTNGAKELNKELAPDLYRLVENLAITSGIPMPKLYVIEDDAPNAFATGRDPEHASVAVTTGLLRRLEKPELEGVLAHELGHIKNYDIRLMTIVVVLVGLLILASDIILRVSFRGGRGRSKNNSQAALIFLVVGIVLGILSPFIAQVIKLAISRTREYLADASGALLTRYPEGLARALEKISAYKQPMKKANHATAHLFIASPFGATGGKTRTWWNRIFSTHPPIEERIAKLRNMGA